MCDFLLAGGRELHAIWPEVACECGKLICDQGHDGVCSWEHGCGVGDPALRFHVVPITSVDGLESAGFDALCLVTPSKKHREVDYAIAMASIHDFLRCLQKKGTAIFALEEQGRHRAWIKIEVL
jgi:hypothetical protein